MNRVKIPRYVDNPMQVFFWEFDDVLPFIAMFGLGLFLHKLLPMAIIGFVMSRYMIKMKATNLRGLLAHTGFWMGLISLNKRDANGLSREFIQ